MSKLRWMKFYPSDWMSDPRLRRCRIDTRGVWMDLLSTMWLHGSGELEMNAQEIGRICGTTRSETLNALRELQMTGTADVDPPIGTIAPVPKTAFKIRSRRIARVMTSMTEERARFKERNNRKRGIARNDTVVTRPDSGETPSKSLFYGNGLGPSHGNTPYISCRRHQIAHLCCHHRKDGRFCSGSYPQGNGPPCEDGLGPACPSQSNPTGYRGWSR